MAVPPPPTKAERRRELRAKRRAFVAGLSSLERTQAAERVAGLVLPHLQPGRTVALYRAIRDELTPDPLSAILAERAYQLALPRPRADLSAIDFAAWSPLDRLMDGPHGIQQPDGSPPSLAPDVVVTPLIGFDRRGRRLGQGGGFYDQAFQRYPAAFRIGYAWSVQEIEAVPTDPWDQPLHAIATEREWISCNPM